MALQVSFPGVARGVINSYSHQGTWPETAVNSHKWAVLCGPRAVELEVMNEAVCLVWEARVSVFRTEDK